MRGRAHARRTLKGLVADLRIKNKLGILPDNVKLFVAKEWTLEWCLFKSPVLRDLFKESVAAVHSRTAEFKKVGTPQQFKEEEFEAKLKKMLEKSSSKLDKTAVALDLAERMKSETLDLERQDMYIKYLIDAISFVCL